MWSLKYYNLLHGTLQPSGKAGYYEKHDWIYCENFCTDPQVSVFIDKCSGFRGVYVRQNSIKIKILANALAWPRRAPIIDVHVTLFTER